MGEVSLTLKFLNTLYKAYTGEQESLPVYHGNDVSEFIPARISRDFVFDKKPSINIEALDQLVNSLFIDSETSLSGLAILYEGKLVKEYYAKPYSNKFRHVSYSLSKTIVALGVGIAIEKKLFSLDTKLFSIFPENNRIFIKKSLKKVTIKHLLTMTAGVTFDEASSYFAYDWRRAYMSSETKFNPGEEFYYNSLNTYMLVAAITKLSGMSFMEFINKYLLEPMNITDITFDKCPMGIERGGWGMKLSLIDMLKIGQLILCKGKWSCNGKTKQLVSSDWINDMISCQVKINDKSLIAGYGFSIWLLNDGSYLANGVFGQNIYINPTRDMVIATIGSAHELFPDGITVDKLCRFAREDDNFRYEKAKIQSNHLLNPIRNIFKCRYENLRYIKEKLNVYLGNEYRFLEYASSILPLSSQIVYSNYLTGIEVLSINLIDDEFVLKVKDSNVDFIIKMGYSRSKPYIYQVITINGKQMPIAVSGKVLYDEDGKLLLKIHIVYLEEVADRIIKLYFMEDKIRLKAYETPDLIRFMNKFIGDDMFNKAKRLKDMMSPDYLDYKVKKILRPDVIGYIDN